MSCSFETMTILLWLVLHVVLVPIRSAPVHGQHALPPQSYATSYATLDQARPPSAGDVWLESLRDPSWWSAYEQQEASLREPHTRPFHDYDLYPHDFGQRRKEHAYTLSPHATPHSNTEISQHQHFQQASEMPFTFSNSITGRTGEQTSQGGQATYPRSEARSYNNANNQQRGINRVISTEQAETVSPATMNVELTGSAAFTKSRLQAKAPMEKMLMNPPAGRMHPLNRERRFEILRGKHTAGADEMPPTRSRINVSRGRNPPARFVVEAQMTNQLVERESDGVHYFVFPSSAYRSLPSSLAATGRLEIEGLLRRFRGASDKVMIQKLDNLFRKLKRADHRRLQRKQKSKERHDSGPKEAVLVTSHSPPRIQVLPTFIVPNSDQPLDNYVASLDPGSRSSPNLSPNRGLHYNPGASSSRIDPDLSHSIPAATTLHRPIATSRPWQADHEALPPYASTDGFRSNLAPSSFRRYAAASQDIEHDSARLGRLVQDHASGSGSFNKQQQPNHPPSQEPISQFEHIPEQSVMPRVEAVPHVPDVEGPYPITQQQREQLDGWQQNWLDLPLCELSDYQRKKRKWLIRALHEDRLPLRFPGREKDKTVWLSARKLEAMRLEARRLNSVVYADDDKNIRYFVTASNTIYKMPRALAQKREKVIDRYIEAYRTGDRRTRSDFLTGVMYHLKRGTIPLLPRPTSSASASVVPVAAPTSQPINQTVTAGDKEARVVRKRHRNNAARAAREEGPEYMARRRDQLQVREIRHFFLTRAERRQLSKVEREIFDASWIDMNNARYRHRQQLVFAFLEARRNNTRPNLPAPYEAKNRTYMDLMRPEYDDQMQIDQNESSGSDTSNEGSDQSHLPSRQSQLTKKKFRTTPPAEGKVRVKDWSDGRRYFVLNSGLYRSLPIDAAEAVKKQLTKHIAEYEQGKINDFRFRRRFDRYGEIAKVKLARQKQSVEDDMSEEED